MKGHMPLLLIVIAGVLVAIGVCRHCSAGDTTLAYRYKKPSGDTLAVAIEMSPLTYSFRNDTAEGFDYELLRNIAQKHGRVAQFFPVGELEEAFEGLYDGKYDILVASMPSTKTLKRFFAVTDPVYIDRQVLVQLGDSTSEGYISSAEQLMSDTVWMVEGAPFGTRLKNLAKELGDSVYICSSKGNSAENLAMLTALGQIPRAVVSEAAARRIAVDYPQLDISTPVSLSHFQCWAVAPGDSVLLDSLNKWLEAYKATPQFESLAQKYLDR